MGGRDNDRLGAALRQRNHIDPLAVDRDRADRQPGLLGDQPLRVPTRVLERDLLNPMRREPATDEREALPKTGGDQQVLGISSRPADTREVVAQSVPQFGHATRVGVADRVQRRLTPGAAQ